MILILLLIIKSTTCQQWQTATPESQGLNSTILDQAAEEVYNQIQHRLCYIVVKNNYIVKEIYYNGWSESSIHEARSTTKSQCSSLFGIAVEQGWANENDKIIDRVSNIRNCNPDATFKNILTMTGESPDISQPHFDYDALGLDCLDTISDFITENNPFGMTAEEFKDEFWHKEIGLEHSTWVEDPEVGHLRCGYTSQMSCRDLARSAQLWLQFGVWNGKQVVDRDHVVKGTVSVFPDSDVSAGYEYGYLVWLNNDDVVDPNQYTFAGADVQCAHISLENNAIIISMGIDETKSCFTVWEIAGYSIVSNK